MQLLLPIIISLSLGILNRVRGGFGGDEIRKLIPIYGTTAARLLFGIGVGASSLLLGGTLTLGLSLIVTTFIGLAIAPFAPFQFMQSSNDILIMSLRGLILTGASGVVIATLHSGYGGLIFNIAGLLMGPSYKLAQLIPIQGFLSSSVATADKNDTAEAIHGIVIGIILSVSLLLF